MPGVREPQQRGPGLAPVYLLARRPHLSRRRQPTPPIAASASAAPPSPQPRPPGPCPPPPQHRAQRGHSPWWLGFRRASPCTPGPPSTCRQPPGLCLPSSLGFRSGRVGGGGTQGLPGLPAPPPLLACRPSHPRGRLSRQQSPPSLRPPLGPAPTPPPPPLPPPTAALLAGRRGPHPAPPPAPPPPGVPASGRHPCPAARLCPAAPGTSGHPLSFLHLPHSALSPSPSHCPGACLSQTLCPSVRLGLRPGLCLSRSQITISSHTAVQSRCAPRRLPPAAFLSFWTGRAPLLPPPAPSSAQGPPPPLIKGPLSN